MKTFLKIAGIVLAVVAFGFIFTLIPDYYATGVQITPNMTWTGDPYWAIGDMNRFWIAVLGILPAVVMVFLRYGNEYRYYYEEWPYRLGRFGCCALVAFANFLINMLDPYSGPITHALSFFLNIFTIIYVLYSLVFHGPFKEKLESHDFFYTAFLPIVSGGVLVIIIALAYILSISGILLPQNITIPIPIGDYYLSISAYMCVILFIYEGIAQLISLPNNRVHKKSTSSNAKAGNFEYSSASQMESYARSACARLKSVRFSFISGKVIHLDGVCGIDEFWNAMQKVSGCYHSNVDGWTISFH